MDQDSAILRLLSDDDLHTVNMVKEALAASRSLEALQSLHSQAAGVAAHRLDELIGQVGQRTADDAFMETCRQVSRGEDAFEEACWRLAATFQPGRDFSPERALLDEWGQELARRVNTIYRAEDRVEIMAHYLGRELRFRGNDADYYSIQNSLLPRVIESRLGIPITLSLLYLLVGSRAGLAIEGVALPGHFVARHDEVFFDPFHGGRRIGLEECASLLRQQNLSLTPQHLRPAAPREMLLRMLTNIYYIAEQTDPPLAARISRWAETLR